MNYQDEWLLDIYYTTSLEIGSAISRLHSTLHWSAGITTAAVAVLSLSPQPYPQVWTLGAVIVAFLLCVRLFVHACLAYAALTKWNELNRLITEYELADDASEQQRLREKIIGSVRLSHIQWRSPKPIRSVLWSTLKLGYVHMFSILSALCIRGFAQASWSQWTTWALLVLLVGSIVYEIVIFPRKTYLASYNAPPTPQYLKRRYHE